jgi:hypothetical protein
MAKTRKAAKEAGTVATTPAVKGTTPKGTVPKKASAKKGTVLKKAGKSKAKPTAALGQ